MSGPSYALPRGIRNNNPGNLRAAAGPDFKTTIEAGFAKFDSMSDGVTSLIWLIHSYYNHLGLRTLPAFVSRYAPATENDVRAYELAMVKRLRINPLALATTDLQLGRVWRVIDFTRALIEVECGPAPNDQWFFGEWISPNTLMNAMERVGKWPGA